MKIKYPVSFCLSIGLMIVTALLTVALHGFLFITAVVVVLLIWALPWISRFEAGVDHSPWTRWFRRS